MEELTRLRVERGWSQQRLADESGVNKATVNQIERGRRSPNLETLEKLAEALGTEMAEFFPKAQASLPDFNGQERRVHEFVEVVFTVAREWEKAVPDMDLQKLPGLVTAALDLAERLGPVVQPDSPTLSPGAEFLLAAEAFTLLLRTADRGNVRMLMEGGSDTFPAEFLDETNYRLGGLHGVDLDKSAALAKEMALKFRGEPAEERAGEAAQQAQDVAGEVAEQADSTPVRNADS
jgi:transcriptional regulator with XRE-family HTH domain